MKRTALFLAGILAISSFSGCGAKNSASDSSEPFEGKYIVTADYVKENLDDIIVVEQEVLQKQLSFSKKPESPTYSPSKTVQKVK